jgi:hypothetical protein
LLYLLARWLCRGAKLSPRLLPLIGVLAIAACTSGKDFGRPNPETLALGRLTRADIESTFGKPTRESTRVVTIPDPKSMAAPTSSGDQVISSDQQQSTDASAGKGTFTTLFYTHKK